MNQIKTFDQKNFYWILLIFVGLSLEAAALYYQYILDEWPCVLCIHIRIWIAGMIAVATLALLIKRIKFTLPILHLLNSVMMAGFVERSWRTLAVERGWVFDECDMDVGLPTWFQLDQWFPILFEAKASCGYTPIIISNISMAETLMLISSLLLLLSFSCFIISLRRKH